MKTKHVLLLSAASLLFMAAILFVLVSGTGKPSRATESAVVRDPAVLDRDYTARLGPPTARVHIVEFLDPACETCAEFFPFVKRLLAAHPDRIRLSVRHVALHKGSDTVVKALEAAKLQGRYWPALEALLASQSTWVPQHRVQPEMVWKALEAAGLDMGRLRTDMESPEVARRVAQDAQDAKALNVTQTPEYFVNGRPLPSFGYEQLQGLVGDALAREYR